MRWELGHGDNGALKFIQSRLREALEVARTTRHREAVYFTELSYLAVSELIREDTASQELQDRPELTPRRAAQSCGIESH